MPDLHVAPKVADTLHHAQDLAALRWHWERYDIYRCLKDAWLARGTDTVVAWTALTCAVRPLVPSGDIQAWNDTEERTRGDVVDLLGRAARSVVAGAA